MEIWPRVGPCRRIDKLADADTRSRSRGLLVRRRPERKSAGVVHASLSLAVAAKIPLERKEEECGNPGGAAGGVSTTPIPLLVEEGE